MGYLTTVEAVKIALKIANNESIELTTFKVGDDGGTAYTPTGVETSLVNVKYTGSITAKTVAANIIKAFKGN